MVGRVVIIPGVFEPEEKKVVDAFAAIFVVSKFLLLMHSVYTLLTTVSSDCLTSSLWYAMIFKSCLRFTWARKVIPKYRKYYIIDSVTPCFSMFSSFFLLISMMDTKVDVYESNPEEIVDASFRELYFNLVFLGSTVLFILNGCYWDFSRRERQTRINKQLEEMNYENAKVSFSEFDNKYDATQCGICKVELDEQDEEETLFNLVCNHAFHFDCVKPWIQKFNTCPLCREPYLKSN